ncbi:MAG TPA: GNAT family N-acetyltransferase [Longimicrobiaceae bacterium]|jgi:ribosomal-protein-alanine N-acetyltransferase|nr:GNAT family N-acetyltransferase [Longimicrobiaceae bacterium]
MKPVLAPGEPPDAHAAVFAAFPVLATERLVLRRLTPADAPALFGIFSDPELIRFWSSPAYTTVEDAHDLVRRIDDNFERRAGMDWGVTLRGDGRVIGKCAFHRWLPDHRRAEIGYAIARPMWRQGLATEAVRALLDFGFAAMGLHSVEAQVDPGNAGSIRTLERLGFVREGHLRENYFMHGVFNDTLVYSLLRRAYRPAP